MTFASLEVLLGCFLVWIVVALPSSNLHKKLTTIRSLFSNVLKKKHDVNFPSRVPPTLYNPLNGDGMGISVVLVA